MTVAHRALQLSSRAALWSLPLGETQVHCVYANVVVAEDRPVLAFSARHSQDTPVLRQRRALSADLGRSTIRISLLLRNSTSRPAAHPVASGHGVQHRRDTAADGRRARRRNPSAAVGLVAQTDAGQGRIGRAATTATGYAALPRSQRASEHGTIADGNSADTP